jgi:acyl-CoA thioesterase-1
MPAAAAMVLALSSAWAGPPGSVAAPAAQPVALGVPSPTQPPCLLPADRVRFAHPLTRVSRHLLADDPIRIVAIGSSSTAGAGASTPDHSYPSRLAAELTDLFPGHEVVVLNRGLNGDEAPGMLARFDKSVIAEQPDLVIWQIGTNWVLSDRPIDPKATVLHQGLARLKAIGADVVLIDPQFAPKVIAKAEIQGMVRQIAATAKEENVDLFRRFALMKYWHENENLPFDTFISPDGLHMNDWSYACLAKGLGAAIAEAATRAVATASVPRPPR